MKYYIATSTLNFNNILSSESISPKPFYEIREFGYSRWTEIHEGVCDNIIVLYKEPFRFSRPQSDLVDYPMLVELDTEEPFERIADGVFCSDKTLYLNPRTTSFIFFAEEDKRIALSRSNSSSETKLLRLYRERMLVNGSLPVKTDLFNQKTDRECNSEAMEKDRKINKMKGLLFGYYLGAYFSEKASDVAQCRRFWDLSELFTAIRTRNGSVPTEEEWRQLKNLLFAVQSPYHYQFRSFREEIDGNAAAKYSDLLKYIDICLKNKYAVSAEQILDWLKNEEIKECETTKPNRAIDWLQKEQRSFAGSIEHKPLKTDKKEIVVADLRLSVLENDKLNKLDRDLLKQWCNVILSKNKCNNKISTYNKDLADALTNDAKNFLGNEWESSEVRTKLNAIRRYLAGEDVDIQWNDDLYSSLAAVLKEGNDWEKLLRFMQRKSMTDYRLAFAIYGELNGFADLTRDLTDKLSELDRNYVWSLYKEINGQVLGDLFAVKDSSQTISSGINQISDVAMQQNGGGFVEKMIKESQNKLGKKDPDLLRELWRKASGVLGSFETMIASSNLTQKGKKAVDAYIRNVQNPELFGTEIIAVEKKLFYKDRDAWAVIEQYVSDPVSKRKIREDLEWFQEELQKPVKDRGYYKYKVEVSDNKKIISCFCNLKSGYDEEKKELKAPYFPQELRELLRKELLKYYGD